jgi:hypothetical protein
MEIGIKILLVLHFIGIGALLSGFFYQLKNFKSGMTINSGILHGAWLMLVSGLGMAGMVKPAELNAFIIAVKAIVLTGIFFIAYTFNKKEKTPTWVVPIIALLTTVNIVLAIFGPVVND